MVTRNTLLGVSVCLFYFFEIFLSQKNRTFRSLIIHNAGVGNDPRDRIFNIKSQAERYDPQGKFRKLWLQNQLF
jgi:hypothetical protein